MIRHAQTRTDTSTERQQRRAPWAESVIEFTRLPRQVIAKYGQLSTRLRIGFHVRRDVDQESRLDDHIGGMYQHDRQSQDANN
jgi:hypothetical protein